MSDKQLADAHIAQKNARTYAQWLEATQAIDVLNGAAAWRTEDSSEDYDFMLMRNRLRQLKKLREQRDVSQLVHHLRQGLHWNLGNISNKKLFSVAGAGTKHLIENYIQEVQNALNYLCDTQFLEFSFHDKQRFFHDVSLSYGRSALMLSGGASLGFFHVGIVKALYEQDLLPKVISGTSAGSIVAASIATRHLGDTTGAFEPEQIYAQGWKMLPWQTILKRRTVMDNTQLQRMIARNVDDLTFEEAYKRNGYILNITVSPEGENQIPRLLNHITFPHLCIREAVLASCAVPFLFPAVMLNTKDHRGARIPYMPTQKWVDGALKSDLPSMRLRRLHNVNHFIVSQTNPHIVPFMQLYRPNEKPSLGQNVRKFVLDSAKVQTRHVVDLLRHNVPFEIARTGFDHLHSMLEQTYQGEITIYPKFNQTNLLKTLSNLTLEDVSFMLEQGERMTWSKLAMIKHQTAISRTLYACLDRLESEAKIQHLPANPTAPKQWQRL